MNNLIKNGSWGIYGCLVGKIIEDWKFSCVKNWMSDTNTLPLCPIWRLEARSVFCSTTSLLACFFFLWLSNLDETVQPLECGTAWMPGDCCLVGLLSHQQPRLRTSNSLLYPEIKMLRFESLPRCFCFLIVNLTNCSDVLDWFGVGSIMVLQCYVYIYITFIY